MPKIIVEIQYDQPDDPYWLNPDNVAYCLNKVTAIEGLKISWAENGDPWKERR